MSEIVYDVPPELTTETHWACATKGCDSICFDMEFAEFMGCAMHYKMVRVVRQFENGKMISEFRSDRL